MKRIIAWICSACQHRVKAVDLPKDLRCPGCGAISAWDAVVRKDRG